MALHRTSKKNEQAVEQKSQRNKLQETKLLSVSFHLAFKKLLTAIYVFMLKIYIIIYAYLQQLQHNCNSKLRKKNIVE